MRFVGDILAYTAIGVGAGLLLVLAAVYVIERFEKHGWDLLNVRRWPRRWRAKRRARGLLLHHLDPLQREDFLKNGGFNVVREPSIFRITSDPQRVYHYHIDGTPMWINGLELHKKKHYRLPAEDIMLSKKLLLETNDPWMCTEYVKRHHPKLDMRYVPAQYHSSPYTAEELCREIARELSE